MTTLPIGPSGPIGPSRPVQRRAVLGLGAVAALGATLPILRAQAAPSVVPTGEVVRASDFGFDAVDATDALQTALDHPTADTVIIDNVDQPWITRPLFIRRSNLVVIVEDGVEIVAKEGGFPGANDSLLSIDAEHDITISGYGATMRMLKPEYTSGEWRMAVALRSTDTVVIEGLALRDSGGDGVYLGVSSTAGSPRHCIDVTLRDLLIDNHRRNGISVISVSGLVIEGCTVSNTVGTNPQAGIDFEPNYDNERLEDIVVRDCIFTENWSVQINFYTKNLAASSPPVTARVERTVLEGQSGGMPMFLIWANGADDPTGHIEITNCWFHNVQTSGALGLLNKSSDTFRVSLSHSVIDSWDTPEKYYAPLHIAADQPDGTLRVDHYGAVDFDDVLVITNHVNPVFNARPYRPADPEPDVIPQLTDVHGDITVISADPITVELGPDPVDVDLTFDNILIDSTPDPLDATVTVTLDTATVDGETVVEVTASRTGGLTAAPLAVRYEITGPVAERHDLAGHSGVIIISGGESSGTVRIPVRTSDSRARIVRVTAVDSDRYAVSGAGRKVIALTPR